MNPKVETVDELHRRRKNLHMGMCKLLREDLFLQAEARPAGGSAPPDTMRAIKERIIKDFDAQTQEHEMVGEAAFNDDAEYKRLMGESIDGKAHALVKLDIYLESVAATMGSADLARIFSARLADFADQAAVLGLRTGITDFPWAAVVLERSVDLDLGDFDAALVSGQARELVASALWGNSNVRSLLVKGVKLELSSGWETAELDWAKKSEAIQAAPVTVSLLLRNCSCLTALDLRYLCFTYPFTLSNDAIITI
jgi:hypothetical protein